MATSEERTLENSIITALQALAYITAQSIPVRSWADQDDARVFPCVIVRVEPRVRIAPNANYYRLPVEIVGARHRRDDPNQSTLDQIYNEISDWVNSVNVVTAFGADGITFNDGIEDVDDFIHHRGVSFDIYDTIA